MLVAMLTLALTHTHTQDDVGSHIPPWPCSIARRDGPERPRSSAPVHALCREFQAMSWSRRLAGVSEDAFCAVRADDRGFWAIRPLARCKGCRLPRMYTRLQQLFHMLLHIFAFGHSYADPRSKASTTAHAKTMAKVRTRANADAHSTGHNSSVEQSVLSYWG